MTSGDGKVLLKRLERFLGWHSEGYYLVPGLNRWSAFAESDSREDQNQRNSKQVVEGIP